MFNAAIRIRRSIPLTHTGLPLRTFLHSCGVVGMLMIFAISFAQITVAVDSDDFVIKNSGALVSEAPFGCPHYSGWTQIECPIAVTKRAFRKFAIVTGCSTKREMNAVVNGPP
jgi:hypothetical protein